jgi:hypothetical protein
VTIDTRFVAFLVWGVGTVLVYGFVLFDRIQRWHHWRDARSLRSMLTAVGLFLTALGAGLSIGFALFGDNVTGIRGLLTATSLGAFFATGLIMATTRYTGGEANGD